MISEIKSFLTHPLVRDLDIDAPETTGQVYELIREKNFLSQIYASWYREIAKSLPIDVYGPVTELGSGGGFMKNFIPDLITSEILRITSVDIILDGTRLPFKKNSLRGIVMIDVLHHIPDVSSFFKEALCRLKPGGVVVMIEPWITSWSKFILPYFHHEPVDIHAPDWGLPSGGGPLSKSNQALPWIVFNRDLHRFKECYLGWNLPNIRLHSPFSYILSGGVSLKSLLPGNFYPACLFVEKLLTPFMPVIAMFATISIKKKENP